ncbi:di-heme-cytochrome C peroxidase [Aurantivibrio plasticivorans]
MSHRSGLALLIQGFKRVLRNVLSFITRTFKHLWGWLCGLSRAALQFWRALGPHWLRVTLVVAVVGFLAYRFIDDYLQPNLTQETVYSLRYLNEGWSEQQRQSFYYTPQGTELFGLEYKWFINLELPLSNELLVTEENMRGWGFIVDPGQRPSPINPGNLPVGLGRHIDPTTQKEVLDIGCAICHTGELHYQGVALRIDGGQAVQSIPNAKRGEFITTLGASIFETLLVPAKWDRFATRVVGHDSEARKHLKKDVWALANRLKDFVTGAGASKYYPVEEGRGRTDAVGRIGNMVFGYDLDQPENLHVADAPASYPFIWDIWRFDWVQYTGFTNQAMARNMGESLGVLAPIKLVDEDGKLLKGEEFGQSLIDIDGLHCAEGLLRDLEPPRWPEDVLGRIDIEQATQGKHLFAERCQHCHGPHRSEPYLWPIADEANPTIEGQAGVNWKWDMAGDVVEKDGKYFRKDWREVMWSVPWLDVDEIGTDPKLADNFINNLYSAEKLIPGSDPVNAGSGLQLLLNELVPLTYERWKIEGEQIPDYDGLNVPFRIENVRAYKARPLHGVWATPPFLHNGSVPTVYHMLSTLEERPTEFYVGNREYDPQHLGYVAAKSPGSFKHDTSIPGNQNIGHLFTDTNTPGRIGSKLSEVEKFALMEYLKVMGNPEFSEALGGDPQDWSQYSAPPEIDVHEQSCSNSHLRHAVSFNKKAAGEAL